MDSVGVEPTTSCSHPCEACALPTVPKALIFGAGQKIHQRLHSARLKCTDLTQDKGINLSRAFPNRKYSFRVHQPLVLHRHRLRVLRPI